MDTKRANATRQYELWFERSTREHYVLSLFIAGMTMRSAESIARIKRLCDTHLPGRHDLQIIDIHQQPELAQQRQILAVPTLVKISPAPERRLIGDFADELEVLRGLDVRLHAKP